MSNIKFSKKSAKILLVLSLFVFFAAGCGKKKTVPNTNTAKIQNSNQTIYTYQGELGKNALQILKEKYPGQIVTKSFGPGEMVESINGKKSETNKTYWAFYVNGKYSNVGAGDYQTKPEDVLEWRLEVINSKL